MGSLVALLVLSFVTYSRAYQIDITGADARSYQSIQNSENQFKYGYQVTNVNDQFQHKLKSADNVTYGCYGYTHPAGEGVHRTFFVADQFGYRTVLSGQPTTIYPAPGTSPVLRQWQELTFPAACFENDNAKGAGASQAANNPNEDRGRSGLEFASSDLRPIVDSSERGHNDMKLAATDLRPIVDSFGRGRSGLEFASTDLRPIAVPYDHDQSDNQSAGSEVVPVTESANHAESANKSNQCWRPFAGENSKSFIQSLQCTSNDARSNQVITLFYPFRVACSDMEAFEKELNLLVTKFDRQS
ncbi:uncharacterized protein LOC120903656 [Anopheles arabiensis]|uniref:Uncharacterized protein n=1 Tax=Anopheles arabiensis TaxID=7173 RepID=A0A182HNI4_ANOAR|nr:uncharacterized protein LOC120903656 [Anopheles arabiensis]